MRLTADFFITAMMRQIRACGGFAYLARRGAHEAGTIFILHYGRDGVDRLYGPASQSFYINHEVEEGRLFILLLEGEGEEKIQHYLKKESQFDPDIWLIEIENLNNIDDVIKLI